jgi:xylan 1,4-beta-xylosidase
VTYANPVIPGFHPDPSVCRVGSDFYLVTSSFEYFPGVPIFHSRDLVHWHQIGHCLSRQSQLPLRGARSSGGIYAPTIRHSRGTFFMITTNTTNGGHFLVTASDPAGEWSEPVWLAGAGIDPSLFFDDDGKVYFSCSSEGIVQREIHLPSGNVEKERSIWQGTGGQYPEGPHLYRIGGRYYLLISEGGTEYGHMLTIARSPSPWGPFEPCPRNPILSHRSLSSPIQATGHGDFVQDAGGNWWVVFLGIRPNGHWPYHHLGRETFLAAVTWDADGWPVIGTGGRAALEMSGPLPPPQPWPVPPERNDFEHNSLGLEWNFLRNPEDWSWSLAERPGWLRLHGAATALDEAGSPAWVGRRQEHFALRVTTRLDFAPRSERECAGVTVWMNERHHYDLFLTLRGGKRCLVVRRRIGSLAAEVACREVDSGVVLLRVDADREMYRFSGAAEAGPPEELAAGETRYLATEVAGGFTGMYVAMFSSGNGMPCSSPADFDWFEYSPLQGARARE